MPLFFSQYDTLHVYYLPAFVTVPETILIYTKIYRGCFMLDIYYINDIHNDNIFVPNYLLDFY
jgi:hypothetical protein